MASVGAALPKLPFEIIPEAPFYIPATGPATRPRRTLKHDDTFLVLDSHGDVGASAGGADGLFHCDTRFLSHLELLLNGTQPLLLGSNVRDDNTQLTVDLTNPDVYFDHRLVLPKDTMHVVRTIFLWRDTAYQRLGIQNHGDRAVDLRLTMLFDSDFADLFEVRGLQRERRGASTRQALRPDTTVLSYKGLDGEFVHKTIDHAVAYVAERVHTNGLENFWSLLKRMVKGTYVHVSPAHLTRYLDEETMRFNERDGNDGTRFLTTMKGVKGKRLTYKTLTGKE